MFTRSSATEPTKLGTRTTNANGAINGSQQHSTSRPQSGAKSVIGNDLKIVGQGLKIVSQGALQIDGAIEGDVQGTEVVVGEQGEVTGMVAAQHVVVRGKVSGIVCGMMVSLQSSARVNGDIHHMSLTIEQGAEFEGRSRRPSDPSELDLVVDARAAIDAKVA
jgi:cytoskeletal protein CcmA (bactofilin family)